MESRFFLPNQPDIFGMAIAAVMAMIMTTTISSISENPALLFI
jgi:hypothetical protein